MFAASTHLHIQKSPDDSRGSDGMAKFSEEEGCAIPIGKKDEARLSACFFSYDVRTVDA